MPATCNWVVLPCGWKISTELNATWVIDYQHTLELTPCRYRTQDDRIRWSYALRQNGRLVFGGTDICSAVGASVSLEEYTKSARSILGWLTLRPGDVEEEYFADYSPDQIAWRDEYAEDLAVLALDCECGYCGGDHVSPACTVPRAGGR